MIEIRLLENGKTERKRESERGIFTDLIESWKSLPGLLCSQPLIYGPHEWLQVMLLLYNDRVELEHRLWTFLKRAEYANCPSVDSIELFLFDNIFSFIYVTK